MPDASNKPEKIKATTHTADDGPPTDGHASAGIKAYKAAKPEGKVPVPGAGNTEPEAGSRVVEEGDDDNGGAANAQAEGDGTGQEGENERLGG